MRDRRYTGAMKQALKAIAASPNTFVKTTLPTPLGAMQAVFSPTHLWLLCFENTFEAIALLDHVPADTNNVSRLFAKELQAYFEGVLQLFKTPFHLEGTPFQQKAWQALLNIPYGHTQSYTTQSASLSHPKAVRAVANANGANPLTLVVPCHRAIHKAGTLGGFRCGLQRKKWLLTHEQTFKHQEHKALA
ncbi:MAG: methylated-DNA--[protein]-cysteine S-methyltransferase [Holosporaceae bacterium]